MHIYYMYLHHPALNTDSDYFHISDMGFPGGGPFGGGPGLFGGPFGSFGMFRPTPVSTMFFDTGSDFHVFGEPDLFEFGLGSPFGFGGPGIRIHSPWSKMSSWSSA